MFDVLAATGTQWAAVGGLYVVLFALIYALKLVHDHKVAATIVAFMVAAAAYFAISALIAILGGEQDWEDFKKLVEEIIPFLDLGTDGGEGGTTTTTTTG